MKDTWATPHHANLAIICYPKLSSTSVLLEQTINFGVRPKTMVFPGMIFGFVEWLSEPFLIIWFHANHQDDQYPHEQRYTCLSQQQRRLTNKPSLLLSQPVVGIFYAINWCIKDDLNWLMVVSYHCDDNGHNFLLGHQAKSNIYTHGCLINK